MKYQMTKVETKRQSNFLSAGLRNQIFSAGFKLIQTDVSFISINFKSVVIISSFLWTIKSFLTIINAIHTLTLLKPFHSPVFFSPKRVNLFHTPEDDRIMEWFKCHASVNNISYCKVRLYY